MTTLIRLLCLLALCGIGWVAVVEARVAHHRGRARVHRGQSWQPRPRATSPDPCRACGARDGWHDQGCGLLDRLDAGQVPA
jgi:hypothetical protein